MPRRHDHGTGADRDGDTRQPRLGRQPSAEEEGAQEEKEEAPRRQEAETRRAQEGGTMSGATRTLLLSLLLSIAAVAAGLTSQRADAAPQITALSLQMSTTQAGGHPDVDIQSTMDTRRTVADPTGCFCVDPKEVWFQFPPGFIGNPHALPVCTLLQMSVNNCPTDAQVGISSALIGQQPLWNMEPHPDEAGLLALAAPLINAPVFIAVGARTDSDFGLFTKTPGIFHLIPLNILQLHIWGVPGDPKHDVNRWPSP